MLPFVAQTNEQQKIKSTVVAMAAWVKLKNCNFVNPANHFTPNKYEDYYYYYYSSLVLIINALAILSR